MSSPQSFALGPRALAAAAGFALPLLALDSPPRLRLALHLASLLLLSWAWLALAREVVAEWRRRPRNLPLPPRVRVAAFASSLLALFLFVETSALVTSRLPRVGAGLERFRSRYLFESEPRLVP